MGCHYICNRTEILFGEGGRERVARGKGGGREMEAQGFCVQNDATPFAHMLVQEETAVTAWTASLAFNGDIDFLKSNTDLSLESYVHNSDTLARLPSSILSLAFASVKAGAIQSHISVRASP